MAKACFLYFGKDKTNLPVRDAIEETVNYLKSKIAFEHTIIEFSDDLPIYWFSNWYNYAYNCYFCDPKKSFNPFLNKIPEGYHIYVALFRMQGKKPCITSACYRPESTIWNTPLVATPYDLDDCFNRVGNLWRYRLTQRIVHDIVNALYLLKLTTRLADNCPRYGYKRTDEGWKSCYDWILSQVKAKLVIKALKGAKVYIDGRMVGKL